jgi:hypothetical protein
VLSAVHGNSNIEGLPTWVPDWTIPFTKAPLGYYLDALAHPTHPYGERARVVVRPNFITTSNDDKTPEHRGTHIRGSDRADHAILQVRGIRLGNVVALGDACPDSTEAAPTHPSPLSSQASWQKLVFNDWRELATSYSLRSSGNALDWAQTDLTYTSTISMDSTFDFHASHGLTYLSSRFETLKTDDEYQSSVFECCRGRRFVVLNRGTMGLVPAETKEGDVVCAFIGALVPFVLRPERGGRWSFVGECYIQGGRTHPLVRHLLGVWDDQQRAAPSAPLEDFFII